MTDVLRISSDERLAASLDDVVEEGDSAEEPHDAKSRAEGDQREGDPVEAEQAKAEQAEVNQAEVNQAEGEGANVASPPHPEVKKTPAECKAPMESSVVAPKEHEAGGDDSRAGGEAGGSALGSTDDGSMDDCAREQAEQKGLERANRRIYERLFGRSDRRRRASDNLILAMPFTQYRDIVQWVADNALVEPPPPAAVPQWIVGLARGMGLDPDHWLEAVDRFESWFGRAVGSAPRIQELLDRTGQRWIHGIRNCRDAFG